MWALTFWPQCRVVSNEAQQELRGKCSGYNSEKYSYLKFLVTEAKITKCYFEMIQCCIGRVVTMLLSAQYCRTLQNDVVM